MSDPFAPLKTWAGTSPGPWMTTCRQRDDVRDVAYYFKGRAKFAIWVATFDTTQPECDADARHVATWDPATCREVVGLLEYARDMADNDSTGHGAEFLLRLDQLNARLTAKP